MCWQCLVRGRCRDAAGGLVEGWNEKDLSNNGVSASGDFWVGTKEFSSTIGVGLDTDSDAGVCSRKTGFLDADLMVVFVSLLIALILIIIVLGILYKAGDHSREEEAA